jgi:acyl-CoA synthetase (AMP-forming)/AMP-acid ligase II
VVLAAAKQASSQTVAQREEQLAKVTVAVAEEGLTFSQLAVVAARVAQAVMANLIGWVAPAALEFLQAYQALLLEDLAGVAVVVSAPRPDTREARHLTVAAGVRILALRLTDSLAEQTEAEEVEVEEEEVALMLEATAVQAS